MGEAMGELLTTCVTNSANLYKLREHPLSSIIRLFMGSWNLLHMPQAPIEQPGSFPEGRSI